MIYLRPDQSVRLLYLVCCFVDQQCFFSFYNYIIVMLFLLPFHMRLTNLIQRRSRFDQGPQNTQGFQHGGPGMGGGPGGPSGEMQGGLQGGNRPQNRDQGPQPPHGPPPPPPPPMNEEHGGEQQQQNQQRMMDRNRDRPRDDFYDTKRSRRY